MTKQPSTGMRMPARQIMTICRGRAVLDLRVISKKGPLLMGLPSSSRMGRFSKVQVQPSSAVMVAVSTISSPALSLMTSSSGTSGFALSTHFLTTVCVVVSVRVLVMSMCVLS
jgi:hypothetical protein